MAPKRDRKPSDSPRASQPAGRASGGARASAAAGGKAVAPARASQADPISGSASGFAAPRLASPPRPGGRSSRRQQAIPDAVANRMARRIAIATGIPTLMGMGVFVASYLLVSRGIVDIAPAVTLTASGACFLLGLLGLSYGVLSSSWEEAAGTLLGREQIGLNLGRVRASIRAMRQADSSGSQG